MQLENSLTILQQELLKLYSSGIDDADLFHIKRYLAKYFVYKAVLDANKMWDENYAKETLRQWSNENDTDQIL